MFNWKLEIRNYFKMAICVSLLCFSCEISCASDVNPIYSIHIDEATIERGYEIKGFDGEIQVAVFPYVLTGPTRIELKNRTKIAMMETDGVNMASVDGDKDAITSVSTTTEGNSADLNINTPLTPIKGGAKESRLQLGEDPEGWKINSDIYEFDVRDKNSYDGGKPLVVTVKYGFKDDSIDFGINNPLTFLKEGLNRQKMFYFNGGKNEWIPLPSTIMYEDNAARAIIHLPYAKVAIFEHTDTMALGSASWYKYKGCNCAASPDYPKGTKLKITATNSNKSVIVEVNDYGPDRNIFPERVIDLDAEAFKILAPKGAGVIDVKVEPIDEICSYAFEKAKHPQSPPPEITALYAALIDEPTGEVFFQKNGDKRIPLASIAKLMTANVFLDSLSNIGCRETKSCVSAASASDEWNRIIAYNKADDLDGAKLYVNDGEAMTLKDIFYSMLVGSANNAAKTLVRNSGIGYDDFVEKMNKQAQEWHLENTRFKDPTGLNIENVSTALDIANMARQVFKNIEMLKATTIQSYSFKTINTGNPHTIKTTNNLLYDKDLYITGAKTGFLNEAGHCLVLKAKNRNNGREVIGVILGAQSSEARFEDMKKLIQWGLE